MDICICGVRRPTFLRVWRPRRSSFLPPWILFLRILVRWYKLLVLNNVLSLSFVHKSNHHLCLLFPFLFSTLLLWILVLSNKQEQRRRINKKQKKKIIVSLKESLLHYQTKNSSLFWRKGFSCYHEEKNESGKGSERELERNDEKESERECGAQQNWYAPWTRICSHSCS